VTTVASSYHIEINPGDAGNADRFVVQDLIKEMAQYNPALAAGEGAAGGSVPKAWKVLLLSEVDRLSKEAQAALRRTMEKYTATCRLILVATSLSKVIEPVRSRCLGVRVPAPSQPEIMAILRNVAAAEKVALPEQVAAKIAMQSLRNVRRCVGGTAAAAVKNGTRRSLLRPPPPLPRPRPAAPCSCSRRRR
jgi:replication factor C subunit 3/5